MPRKKLRYQYRKFLNGDPRIRALQDQGWEVYKRELFNTPLGPMVGFRLRRRGRVGQPGSQRMCDETFETWSPLDDPDFDPR